MILTDKNTIINRYIRKKITQYKQNKAELVTSDQPIEGVEAQRRAHPILMFLLRVKSKLSGLTYEFVNEKRVNAKSDKTVIYAITHIGKFDYEMLIEACDIFAYPFAGDWELMYATVDDYFLRANGVLWVDTSDKEDRQNSFKYMLKALKQGIPMLIYPEGLWNLSPNRLHLPITRFLGDAAQKAGRPVVPMYIEYTYDTSGEKERIPFVHLRYGESITVKEDDNLAEKLEEYMEKVSTMRWDLMAEKGTFSRHEITNWDYINYMKGNYKNLDMGKIGVEADTKAIYGADSERYLFQHINIVPWDAWGVLKETEEVERLKKINIKQGI